MQAVLVTPSVIAFFKLIISRNKSLSLCVFLFYRDLKLRQVREGFLKRVYINKYWSVKLMCCEILNLLHVVLQVHITNQFLSGNFLKLGSEIWTEGLDSNVDVLDDVFPKVRFTLYFI